MLVQKTSKKLPNNQNLDILEKLILLSFQFIEINPTVQLIHNCIKPLGQQRVVELGGTIF